MRRRHRRDVMVTPASGNARRRFVLATLLAVLMQTLVAPASATIDIQPAPDESPNLLGRWSKPFWEGGDEEYDPPSLEKAKKFPTAVSAVVLPDGRFLYWNGTEGYEDGTVFIGKPDMTFAWENARARLLDLRSGEPHWSVPRQERGTTDEAFDHQGDGSRAATKDLFCSDHKLLFDGTVLIAGGTEARPEGGPFDVYGDDETRIFEPRTDRFRSVEPMREPRWYPALVTLSDGRIMVVSGARRLVGTFLYGEPGFSQVRLNEIYDPATERWQDAGVGEWSLPLYPRLHLLPDGKVFYGGVGEYWTPFGQTADQANWAIQRVWDPATKTWTMLDPDPYGGRSGASSTLLRLEPPYDEAKILITGGSVGVSPGTWAATTLSDVVRWTRGEISNEAVKNPLGGLAGDPSQLRNRRWFGTTVMLPTGEVLLLNGGDADDALDPGSAAAVRTPELYDPATDQWRELATASRERVYHNSAVLLPDGRVLVGGHAPLPTHYANYAAPARSNQHRDATFEIYEPPYLFRGPRPVVANVDPVRNGRVLKLALGKGTTAGEIAEVVLVRMSANTHTIDADMRAVKLEHTAAGSNLFAELPKRGDGRILPPGPYYVFALRQTPDGPVPSVAHTVLIQPGPDGKVVARGV